MLNVLTENIFQISLTDIKTVKNSNTSNGHGNMLYGTLCSHILYQMVLTLNIVSVCTLVMSSQVEDLMSYIFVEMIWKTCIEYSDAMLLYLH